MEKLDSELKLQRSQMMTHCTVRQVQFFCGTAEAASPSGGFKRTQRLQWGKAGSHDVKFYSHCPFVSLAGKRCRNCQ
jgi:hypothetical protein